MKSLVDIMVENNWRNDTHYEFGTDKEFNHRYCTAFYDKEFLNYKDKEIKLLEIGVHRGGGLAVFHEYFSKAQIYGVDPIDFGAKLNCAKFPRINITYADGYRREFAETLSNFDIIIDDGSHVPSDQIVTFNLLRDRMNSGGLYIVEDILDVDGVYSSLKSIHANCDLIDLRNVKNRFDDALIVLRF